MGNSQKDYHDVDTISMCVGFLIICGTELIHVFPDERHRIELSFPRNFWISISFVVVLVALFLRWVVIYYASAASREFIM